MGLTKAADSQWEEFNTQELEKVAWAFAKVSSLDALLFGALASAAGRFQNEPDVVPSLEWKELEDDKQRLAYLLRLLNNQTERGLQADAGEAHDLEARLERK